MAIWQIEKHKRVRRDVAWSNPMCWESNWDGKYSMDFDSEAKAWNEFNSLEPTEEFPLITISKIVPWKYWDEEGEEYYLLADKCLDEHKD